MPTVTNNWIFFYCFQFTMKSLFLEQKLVLKSDLEQLLENDNHGKWRQEEADQLFSEVQLAIHQLQNPSDCRRAKKLVCHLSYYMCGLGCLIHHTAYCLITALATRRVLILSDEPWYYSNITIKKFFLPVSSTCTDVEGTRGLCLLTSNMNCHTKTPNQNLKYNYVVVCT